VLLNREVRKKVFAVLNHAFSRPEWDYAELPNIMPIFTLAEVEQVYKRAESALAGFPEQTAVP
jgi:hypothetical protein